MEEGVYIIYINDTGFISSEIKSKSQNLTVLSALAEMNPVLSGLTTTRMTTKTTINIHINNMNTLTINDFHLSFD
jgi:hypothetical protein